MSGWAVRSRNDRSGVCLAVDGVGELAERECGVELEEPMHEHRLDVRCASRVRNYLFR